MAEMNLLTGSYNGTLGQTVGFDLHGQHLLRSTITGKRTMTATQIAARLAMEQLNRLSIKLTEIPWSQWGFSRRLNYPHSILSHYFKACVAGYQYALAGCNIKLPTIQAFEFATVNYGQASRSLRFTIRGTDWDNQTATNYSWILVQYVDNHYWLGRPIYTTAINTETPLPPYPVLPQFLLALNFKPTKNGYACASTAYSRITIRT